MIRFLLKIGLMLVAGILIYNFFFGNAAEKEQSRKVFGQVRGVVVSVGDLLKSERAKFDAGKYDGALDKLGNAYRAIRERAKYLDKNVMDELESLEQRKAALQQELDSIQEADQQPSRAPQPTKKGLKKDPKAEQQAAAKAADQQRRKEQLQKELEDLVRDSERLLQKAEQ